MRAIEPEGWLRGPGFSHAFATEGEDLVYISGVIGNDPKTGAMIEDGVVEQAARAFRNVVEVARAAGSEADRVAFLRVYVTDREAYMSNLREIGRAFREAFGGHYPAMTFLVVEGLFIPGSLIEVDGVATLPRGGGA
jgi:enamine deaminase RidA (YjgF/YER057c/UK114 family)